MVGLGELTQLETLRLRRTRVTDAGLRHLRELRRLRFLEIFLAPEVTDAGLSHLEATDTLRHLDLTNTGVADESLRIIGRHTQLTELILTGTEVSDQGLRHLEALTQLNTLHLLNTNVSPEGVAGLQERIPRCRILHGLADQREVAENILELGGKIGIGPLFSDQYLIVESLEELPDGPLSISNVAFAGMNEPLDEELAILQGLPDLKSVNIHSHVSEVGMARLGELTQLERLGLSRVGLTNAGLGQLRELRQLLDWRTLRRSTN